jgi:hypothetical protein
MKNETLQKRFAEIITKVTNGKTLNEAEKSELNSLGKDIGGKIEEENGKSCYWVCQNNFMCNPQSPPPNCRCRRVCI